MLRLSFLLALRLLTISLPLAVVGLMILWIGLNQSPIRCPVLNSLHIFSSSLLTLLLLRSSQVAISDSDTHDLLPFVPRCLTGRGISGSADALDLSITPLVYCSASIPLLRV